MAKFTISNGGGRKLVGSGYFGETGADKAADGEDAELIRQVRSTNRSEIRRLGLGLDPR